MSSELDVKCSEEMQNYFNELKEKSERCLYLALEARQRGLDPELKPEIIMTEDLAARVDGLVGPKGIGHRIRELSKEVPSREILSLTIAQELAKELSIKNKREAVEQAVRTGLAILTEGVLVAPLEGIAKVDIEKNQDGSEFLSIFFAGPIRSAGGTGQAMSVLIGDIVRRGLGLDKYKPSHAEIERMKEEISLYHRRLHLQYEPNQSEIELIMSSCPVCIDGEGTEDEEVSGYRNISRIKTTKIRGGACLVISEGLCLKAAKIQKIVKLAPKVEDETGECSACKYIKQVDDIFVLTLPSKVTRPVTVEVDGDLRSKLKEITNGGSRKMILDMGKVAETNVSLIKLIIAALNHCEKASVNIKVVANPKLGEELKGFQETSDIPVLNSIDDAKAAL